MEGGFIFPHMPFLSYLVCKNPLCNYDIELKGYVFEYPENNVDSVELIKLK